MSLKQQLAQIINMRLQRGETIESIAADTQYPHHTVGNIRKVLRGYEVDVDAFACIASAVGVSLEMKDEPQ